MGIFVLPIVHLVTQPQSMRHVWDVEDHASSTIFNVSIRRNNSLFEAAAFMDPIEKVSTAIIENMFAGVYRLAFPTFAFFDNSSLSIYSFFECWLDNQFQITAFALYCCQYVGTSNELLRKCMYIPKKSLMLYVEPIPPHIPNCEYTKAMISICTSSVIQQIAGPSTYIPQICHQSCRWPCVSSEVLQNFEYSNMCVEDACTDETLLQRCHINVLHNNPSLTFCQRSEVSMATKSDLSNNAQAVCEIGDVGCKFAFCSCVHGCVKHRFCSYKGTFYSHESLNHLGYHNIQSSCICDQGYVGERCNIKTKYDCHKSQYTRSTTSTFIFPTQV